MEKVLIDILGTGLEIFIVMAFFKTFCAIKKFKWPQFICRILPLATMNIIVVTFLQNSIVLPITFVLLTFSLSFFFSSSITFKVMLSFIISATMAATEILTFVLTMQVFSVQAEQIHNSLSMYVLGMLVSKLLSLFLVYVLRTFMKKGKQETDRRFNLLMAFMPMQSIILCFIVYGYSVNIDPLKTPTLGVAAVAASLFLVFIIMLVLNNQRKALIYKKEYELAQFRLETQIEHYQKLYQAQHELRSIRHDISNNMLAISGMLEGGMAQKAMDRIQEIYADVKRTSEIVDTGLPPIDAVLNAKIAKGKESDISIKYTVRLSDDLRIDQFDLAIIVANALDNAIEGILRSSGVDEKVIMLKITGTSDYISVFVENSASGPINEDFQTSKPDKGNHGFGIPQMKSVALKYVGDVQPEYDPEAGVFSLKALLKNQPV